MFGRSVLRAALHALLQMRQQHLPPFAVAAHEDHVREMVTRHMLLGHAVPALMLDRHACLLAHGLEADFDFGVLLLRERRLSPTEDQPLAALPDPDTPDLPDLAVRQRLDE